MATTIETQEERIKEASTTKDGYKMSNLYSYRKNYHSAVCNFHVMTLFAFVNVFG